MISFLSNTTDLNLFVAFLFQQRVFSINFYLHLGKKTISTNHNAKVIHHHNQLAILKQSMCLFDERVIFC